MKIRYLSGIYNPAILQPVEVDVKEFELDNNLLLLFNPQLRNGEELLDLDNFTLMGAKFKNLLLFRVFQNALLLLAGIFAAANVISGMVNGEIRNVFQVIMLFASIGFAIFAGFNIKASIERHLYGGVFSKEMDIYFQTDEEKNRIGLYFTNIKNIKQKRRK